MTVAVAGGTGTLGSLVVADLLGRGERVVVLSRNAAGVPAGAEHRRVDLTGEEGLDLALDGVRAVVDAANSQKAARETLVANHLTISIVGIDRVPISYYKAKLAQEEALEASEVPWTILRATQFHQLVDSTLASAARFGLRPTGQVKVQPIDPTIVAARLAEAALAAPAGRLPDIAGPRVQTLGELSATWAAARGKRLLPLRVPAIGKAGKALAAGAICDERAATPGEDFAEWLRHG
jgi:uncharacterized protein YbjT (DUF2867 family)